MERLAQLQLYRIGIEDLVDSALSPARFVRQRVVAP